MPYRDLTVLMTLGQPEPCRNLAVLMTLARGLPFLYCPRTPFLYRKSTYY